jgi:hypothetical protein
MALAVTLYYQCASVWGELSPVAILSGVISRVIYKEGCVYALADTFDD